MAYTAQKPHLVPLSSELTEQIPHWGVDLDRNRRPAVPKEHFIAEATGAHWDFPERQHERYPRERSPEHKFLTPVFGTACPPRGMSGLIRRYAYTLSEGRAWHWLLLLGADRVNLVESRIQALLKGHPDNPITEAGLRTELTHHGLRSRIGQHRGDLKTQAVQAAMSAFVWLAFATVTYRVARRLANGR
jgi:hypothetical protein